MREAGNAFSTLATTLAKKSPRRGSQESWRRLIEQHLADAQSMTDAARVSDLVMLRAAHQRIAESCKACHDAHRFRRGN